MPTQVNMPIPADLLHSIAELSDRLRRSRAVVDHAAARGLAVDEGTDDSGTITIVIDDEGAASNVRVAPHWRHRLTAAELEQAVVAADTDAANRRSTVTVQALASTDVGTDEPPSPTGAAPGRSRSLSELSAAVLAACDDLDRIAQPPPPVHGRGAQGAVEVTMTQGRVTRCVVDQRWLARQDEVTLAHALREAVTAAASARLAARAPFVDFQQRLDAILADARATLLHAGGAR